MMDDVNEIFFSAYSVLVNIGNVAIPVLVGMFSLFISLSPGLASPRHRLV